MHRGIRLFFPVVVSVGLALSVTGCASSPSSSYSPPPNPVSAKPTEPDTLSVIVRVRDYSVENYSVSSSTGPIKDFSIAGTPSSDGRSMFFRLEPILYDGGSTNYYYLIEVPGKSNGEYQVQARKMSNGINMQKLAPPLYDFKLVISVVNGLVAAARIEDYGDRTVGMRLVSSRKQGNQVIAQIGSRIYTDTQWECPMPRDDGEWRVSCTKI